MAATVRYAHDDAGQPGLDLPPAIVRALGTDERVLSCPGGTQAGTSLFAPDWVAVRRVDLDGDQRSDWIVNGRHACLRDGSAVAWWVYADTGDGQRLLLQGAVARTLEVLATRTRGFRDLRLSRTGDAAAVARYDGGRYTPPDGVESAAAP